MPRLSAYAQVRTCLLPAGSPEVLRPDGPRVHARQASWIESGTDGTQGRGPCVWTLPGALSEPESLWPMSF